MEKRVLIATGGTGGHLFPAQALASSLQAEGVKVVFAGHGLSTNPYFFERDRFSSFDISSLTPFGGKKRAFYAPWALLKGVMQSLFLIAREKPSLLIGFGSYHTFPLLVAARLTRTPYALFEPNAYPGRVNRLFAGKALFTATCFEEVRSVLKGEVVFVRPLLRSLEPLSKEEAAHYFGLDPKVPVLLVFGGSQGAQGIDCELMRSFAQGMPPKWQVVHLTGSSQRAEEVRAYYKSRGIRAVVKPFERHMAASWSIADLLVARSGASTLFEQMQFAVPAIYIPFPHASDDHQTKNAQFVVARGGGYLIEQGALSSTLERCMQADGEELNKMRGALRAMQEFENRPDLASLVHRFIKTLSLELRENSRD